MFRKIDRWIGWHMSAARWAVLWLIVCMVTFSLFAAGGSCLWIIPCAIGALMTFANIMRI